MKTIGNLRKRLEKKEKQSGRKFDDPFGILLYCTGMIEINRGVSRIIGLYFEYFQAWYVIKFIS